ncbi:hypothetical protein DCCM_1983 [Desulfocucumis palustris]|uniref:Uncharacterized protein n=1 Tax=Desulfocucumis palustris TaxID=1898651 RepID=A0A2L2XF65_9FIRM|nr:hypothetical protein DCCM_1983 [Desulfocucumis palustris]
MMRSITFNSLCSMFVMLQVRQRIILMSEDLPRQQKRVQLCAVNKLLNIVTNRLLVF